MRSNRSNQPSDWREGRRLRAWELKQKGWKQKDIAEALGVTPGAVSQWMKRVREGGEVALRRRVAPGAPRRLRPEQLTHLTDLLAKGAEACGFRGAVWTQARVAAVIRQEFGVVYHPRHMGRVLRALGWTQQKPIRRASQRNEEAIQRWRVEDWPQSEKKR
jgi:transposase